jgi:hypothetical protein
MGCVRVIRTVVPIGTFAVRLIYGCRINIGLLVRLVHPTQDRTIYPGAQHPLPLIRRLIRAAWHGRKPLRHIQQRHQVQVYDGMRVAADQDVLAMCRHGIRLQHANTVPPRSKAGELIVPMNIGKRGQQGKCIHGTKQLDHDPH